MKKIYIVLIIVLCYFSTGFTARFYVPTDYSTIQAAIDAAADLDTVMVNPGTYTGLGNVDLTFNGKNICLRATNYTDVIIDCNGSPQDPHIAVLLDNNETNESIIMGLTIINAYSDTYGAALTFLHGSATVRYCHIENNLISGIFYSNYSTAGSIDHCDINNNFYGIAYTGTDLQIDHCNIMGNQYNGINVGGQTIITSSVIANNGEYGLFHQSSFPQSVTVMNCTFAMNNTGLFYGWEAPKSNAEQMYNATISNSIFAFNHTTGIELLETTANIECTDSYGNPDGNWTNVDPTIITSNGNLEEDPLFCDTTNGDFHLSYSSPCYAPNNSCNLLIGALNANCHCCRGIRGNIDFDPNDEINISDVVWFVLYAFSGGPGPICSEEADVEGDGMWDIGDLVYLLEYMFLGGPEPPPCPDYN